MNKKEAISLLKNSWFVSLDGKHAPADALKAIALAEKCFDEAKPYKAEAKALKAENKALVTENNALHAELSKLVSAFKTLFRHVTLENFNDPNNVEIHVVVPRGEYMANVDQLETDPRYAEEKENEKE